MSHGRMMPKPDYQSLIDAPTWAFVAATEACYPLGTAQQTIAAQRAIYDQMCAVFHAGYPPGISAVDRVMGGVPVRCFAGDRAVVVYLHGGGFVVGGLQSHDDICAEICAATGYYVICVDYRLSPEHPHPAAYDDARAVTLAALGLGLPVVMVGDSAGANLAAAVTHSLRQQIAGQILIYPGLGGNPDQGSYLTHAQAPMLTRDDVLFYHDIRRAAPDDPTAYPLRDPDFAGLPPTLAISAACDPLSDDARDYAAAITAAGGRAEWVEVPGLVHGYLRARHSVPRARASFDHILRATTKMGALP
jgi:acetyl esterase